MKKSSLSLFLALIIFIFIAGCSAPPKDPEIQLLETTIRRYNRALVDAYKELSVDPLQGIASEREMGKVDMIINGFRAKNQYMEAELKRIEIKEIKRKGGDSVDVETREHWRYRNMDKKTGQEMKPWTEADYKLIYYLVKSEGNWMVGTVEFIKEGK